MLVRRDRRVAPLDPPVTALSLPPETIFRRSGIEGQRRPVFGRRVIVRERMSAAGIDPAGYSGHSLRAGFATSATRAGVSTLKIRQQTGHASDAMLSRYIRERELFLGNAAGVLL